MSFQSFFFFPVCCRWKDVRINGTVFYFLFATFFAHLRLAYLVLDGDFGYFLQNFWWWMFLQGCYVSWDTTSQLLIQHYNRYWLHMQFDVILNLGISHLNLHYNIYLGFHILFAKLNMNCTYLFYYLWFLVSNPWVNLDQSGSSSNLSQECQLADIVHIVILSISQFVAIKLIIVNSKWNGIVEVL